MNWWTVLTLDMASIPAPGPLEIEGSEGRVNNGLDPAVVAALIKLGPTSHQSIIKRLQPQSLWDCLSDKVGVGIMFG